jgi:hypothetical protein
MAAAAGLHPPVFPQIDRQRGRGNWGDGSKRDSERQSLASTSLIKFQNLEIGRRGAAAWRRHGCHVGVRSCSDGRKRGGAAQRHRARFRRPLLSQGRQFLCTTARAPRRKLAVSSHIARLSRRAVRASVLDGLCAVAISSLAARAHRKLIYGFRLGAL